MTAETKLTKVEPPADQDYPKLPHLSNLDEVVELMRTAANVWITEEIDGMSLRLGRTHKGELWVGTRNLVVDQKTKLPMSGFAPYFEALGDAKFILPGMTIFGEWAGKGIQKRIDYEEPTLYVFAVMYASGVWMDPVRLMNFCRSFELRTVPSIYTGPMPSVEQLETWRKTSNLFPAIEGVVLWPSPMINDRYGHPVIAKFKNPDFKERSSKTKTPAEKPDLSDITKFVKEYVTAERVRHVIQNLFSLGIKHPLAAENTGELLRAVVRDVEREGKDDLAKLPEEQRKQLGRVSNEYTKKFADALRSARLKES